MASQRLTDKTALTANLANDDLLMCVDTSDNTGSSVGTSKKIASKYIIQTDIKDFDSATTNALNTTPQELITSPGAGYILQPFTFTLLATYVSAENTNNVNLYVGYNTTVSTTNYIYQLRSFYRNEGTEDRTYIVSAAVPADGTFNGSAIDKPLGIWSSGDFNGTWTLKVLVSYQIVKV